MRHEKPRSAPSTIIVYCSSDSLTRKRTRCAPHAHLHNGRKEVMSETRCTRCTRPESPAELAAVAILESLLGGLAAAADGGGDPLL